jgi:hypothetical protein
MTLNPACPDEEWGFTAHQAVEKLLRALIVLSDQRPPFTHGHQVLATWAAVNLPENLLALPPDAVEARYEEGAFAPGARMPGIGDAPTCWLIAQVVAAFWVCQACSNCLARLRKASVSAVPSMARLKRSISKRWLTLSSMGWTMSGDR